MAAAVANVDFAPMMGRVAQRLFGEPNRRLSRGARLRFGAHGSMEIDTTEGWFDDHEANVRGGVLDLIRHKQGCDTAAAFRWLEDEGIKDPRPDRNRDAGPVIRAAGRVFYDYADRQGQVLFRVERRGKNADPPFLQHGPDGRGGFHSVRGCMQGIRRIPYRLPELLAAPADAIVFVCEGEKDVDRLIALGLVATTNPGGAGKFTRELAAPLAGRRVIALQDNDDAGEKHVRGVLDAVVGVASSAAALLLPGLPDKGDVSDWLAGGGSVADLVRLAEQALAVEPAPAVTFPISDLLAWANTEPEPKRFVMAGFIPEHEVTLFTGPGGTNKSTLGLQLCACSAAGLSLLGVPVQPGSALYVTAEDDDRENHWRLRKIAGAIGAPLDELAGRLHVVSLRGLLNNELATFDVEGRLAVAPAYKLLHATIEATGSKLLVLDNVGHLYVGNENDRGQVTGFINLLYQLCRELGVTVVLVGHPNKQFLQGNTQGNATSGSTAWLNAVRSQLLIERPEGVDPDARVLTLGKANYARPDQQIAFRWHDFALVRDEDLPADVSAEITAAVAANADNATFLACLDERNRQERPVSEQPASRTYAPKVFADMAESGQIGRARLEAAMDRLFRLGVVERGFVYRDTGEGKDRFGVRRSSADLSADLPLTGSADVPLTTRRPPPSLTPYTTYMEGTAQGAAAPSDDAWNANPALGRTDSLPGPILAPGETGDEPIPGWDA